MKLVDGGEVRDDVWELLLINSRTPDLLDGDLRAMLGSTQIGAERVMALVDELGVTAYLSYLDGVLDHADRRMRAAVAGLPDGVLLRRGSQRQRLLRKNGHCHPRRPHGQRRCDGR